jgi:hypothetical protein
MAARLRLASMQEGFVPVFSPLNAKKLMKLRLFFSAGVVHY